MRLDFMKDISTCRILLVSFFISLLIISIQITSQPQRTPHDDEIRYMDAATGLVRNGTYKGRLNPPAYPALVATVSYFDAALFKSVQCFVTRSNTQGAGCSRSFSSLVAVQAVMAAVASAFIFYLAYSISQSWIVAWITMIITLATGEFSYFARTVLSENTAFFGIYGFLLFMVLGIKQKRMSYMVIAGLFIGISILSRSAYLYMAYFSVIMIIALYYFLNRDNIIAYLKLAGGLALGTMVIVLSWSLRNYYWFGDFALTEYFAGLTLVQRVAYNMMTWQEWGISFIYWLPDFGDGLAKSLFSPSSYARLDMSNLQGFYEISMNGDFGKQMRENAGGSPKLFGYLIRERVLGDFFNHILVTIPLTLRGLWAGKYLSLLAVLLFYPAVKKLYQEKKLALFTLFALPLLFMVGFHGAISINIVRYNVPMIIVFSFIVATLAAPLLYDLKNRWLK